VVKIVWTEPALDDIHAIMEFIAQDYVYLCRCDSTKYFQCSKTYQEIFSFMSHCAPPRSGFVMAIRDTALLKNGLKLLERVYFDAR